MKTVTNFKWMSMLVCLVVGFLVLPALATTNYLYFSVNGDTSRTSITQGENVAWAANCAVGATVTWEIWIDLNSNSIIDTLSDMHLVSFDNIDGNTGGGQGPPDTNPTPDGWIVTPPMTLGVAPAHYIFKVTDHTDNSSVQRGLLCTPLLSPPNKFCGRISIDGITAPDPAHLQNIWVEANLDQGMQMWSAFTNEYGVYEINVGSAGTGIEFRIKPVDMPGLVTPPAQIRTASGVIDSINFHYGAPSDSLYGEIRDQNGTLITTPVYVYCNLRYGSGQGKETQTINGAYKIYFSPFEYGEWSAGVSWDNLVPAYLTPNNFEFDNTIVHTQQHNFICYTSNALMYARVTENGNNPAHQYAIMAQSEFLQVGTFAVSGTGQNNLATLHISSLDNSTWNIFAGYGNSSYPIPPGYIWDSRNASSNRHPGDTVNVNFIYGLMVQDTIKLDPGDPPINMNMLQVNMQRDGASYRANPDDYGVFRIYADTGTYQMNVYQNGYLTNPANRWVHVVHDTVGGMGFTINQTHCHIVGILTGIPLPIHFPVGVAGHTGDGGAYGVYTNIDTMTGQFYFQVCDGDWTFDPPSVPDYNLPTSIQLNILEAPDSLRMINFVYEAQGVDDPANSLPDKFLLFQNYPNPFNAQTVIQYGIPTASNVKIEVYDLLGRKLETLHDGQQEAGYYTVTWDAAGRPSGIYFFSLKTDSFSQTRKMLLLK